MTIDIDGFIRFVLKFWLQFALTSISGILAWYCKKLYKESKEQKKEREELLKAEKAKEATLENALLAILHDNLLRTLTFFLEKKEITSDEFDNVRLLFDAYTKLGGNGTIKVLYLRFEKYVHIVTPDYIE